MRTAVRAWDCETGTAELWGQKASPWHPDNYSGASATLDAELRYRYNTESPAPGFSALRWAFDYDYVLLVFSGLGMQAAGQGLRDHGFKLSSPSEGGSGSDDGRPTARRRPTSC